jgi:hypothetical protein
MHHIAYGPTYTHRIARAIAYQYTHDDCVAHDWYAHDDCAAHAHDIGVAHAHILALGPGSNRNCCTF